MEENYTQNIGEKDEKDLAKKIYDNIVVLKQSGYSDDSIVSSIVEMGVEENDARSILEGYNATSQNTEVVKEKSSVPGWLIWIGILVLLNVLSAVFDWPFWFY